MAIPQFKLFFFLLSIPVKWDLIKKEHFTGCLGVERWGVFRKVITEGKDSDMLYSKTKSHFLFNFIILLFSSRGKKKPVLTKTVLVSHSIFRGGSESEKGEEELARPLDTSVPLSEVDGLW